MYIKFTTFTKFNINRDNILEKIIHKIGGKLLQKPNGKSSSMKTLRKEYKIQNIIDRFSEEFRTTQHFFNGPGH